MNNFIGGIELFNGDNFELFEQQMEYMITLNDIDDSKKIPFLLSNLTPRVLQTLNYLCGRDKPTNKSYNELLNLLENRYAKSTSQFLDRNSFRSRNQLKYENIENYLIELKKLAKRCDFEDVEDQVKEKLIDGVNEPVIKFELMRNADASLDKLIMMARTVEDALKQSRMGQELGVSLNGDPGTFYAGRQDASMLPAMLWPKNQRQIWNRPIPDGPLMEQDRGVSWNGDDEMYYTSPQPDSMSPAMIPTKNKRQIWNTPIPAEPAMKNDIKSTMERSVMAPQGMVVTPHYLATQTALAILREGGTAMEAMVAAAATISVVYPHMNSIGGDGFWLIVPPHGDPVVIEACGAAGSLANVDFLAGEKTIPVKGVKSALTVPGTIGGWQEALNYVRESGYQNMSVSRLLSDAIRYAEDGFPVSRSLELALTCAKNFEKNTETFKDIFLPNGRILKEGETLRQKKYASTLRILSEEGLDSFYRGNVGDLMAEDMAALKMAITREDLANYTAVRKTPLRLQHSKGELINIPPPTQGTVSLAILGILDKLNIDGKNEGQFIHTTVEATKQAFQLRDQYITDPRYMTVNAQSLLSDRMLENMAKNINPGRASSRGSGKVAGDTIWMGIMDNKGFSVSFNQSLYYTFGSGIVLPKTGITLQNRGAAFVLDQSNIKSLKPGKKPYHTLNPAAAKLNDGRLVVYGTRGGDGQSQTQAAIFHRYAVQGLGLQMCVSSPRWIYGSQVGNTNHRVNLEDRYSNDIIEYLKIRGHTIGLLPSFSEQVGQAGMVVRHPNGMFEGAGDPRADGNAAGF